jgi:hypothetical protein
MRARWRVDIVLVWVSVVGDNDNEAGVGLCVGVFERMDIS